jgi:hypothetical protein
MSTGFQATGRFGAMLHYTDKDGWNAIRSQQSWRFMTFKPKDPNRPTGAYFTDIEPSAANLRVLYKKIRVPREKQECAFWFDGDEGLTQLNDGTGRDKRIFFSPVDYLVSVERQRYGDNEGDNTQKLMEQFT